MNLNPQLMILTSRKSAHVVTHAESPSVQQVFDVRRSFTINDGKPVDLIYTQMYGQRQVFEQLARTDAPYVINVGGDIWHEREAAGKISSLPEVTRVMQHAAKVICVSKYLADLVRSKLGTDNVCSPPGGMWGLDNSRYGIDPSMFVPRSRYAFGSRRPIIAMAINLTVERKWCGIPVFFEAAADVLRAHDARVVCFGKIKRHGGAVAVWQRDYGLEHYGFVKNWPNALAGCDVFVHPSMFDGFPRAVGDACCAAVPALVFNKAGTPEVSAAALKCDPYNAVDIATKLESLLGCEAARRRVGQAMRREAVRKTKKHHGDYARLLQEVIA